MITDRRAAAFALAALLAAPALAGCLGSAQASAMDQQGTAEERAREWDEDAQLAFVLGVEGDFAQVMTGNWSGSGWGGSSGSGWGEARTSAGALGPSDGGEARAQQDSSSSYWDRAREDDSRGDGQAVLWLYIFVSPNEPDRAFKVVVDEEGEVVEAKEEANEGDLTALGEWSVDSDEAAEIAIENNEGIRTASESEHHSFFYILEDDDEHPNPTWGVAAAGGDESGGGGGFVEVDARTGDVLASHGGSSSSGDY